MAKGSTKVLLIDEHPIFLTGMSSLFKNLNFYTVTGAASDAQEAIRIAKKEKPHLVIMEFRFGDMYNLDLVTRLKSLDPQIAILILSMCDERYFSERLLNMGVRGFIMKKESVDEVIKAVKTVTDGKVYLSESQRERVLDAMTDKNRGDIKDWSKTLQKLSDREFQVFSLIGKGYGTPEIASKFNISSKTIDTHKEHIKHKLRCGTSQQVRQLAIEWSNNSGSL
jgi:DNA-binding NarL/FixJ family response regulator